MKKINPQLMKRLTGYFILLICCLVIIYRLVNVTPSKNLSPNEQAIAILNSGKCTMCHSQNPDLPFYASLPIIGKVVKEDALLAVREIDLDPAMNALNSGEIVDEVSLNKIEKCIADGTMPLAKFYLMHWGSSINNAEKRMMLNWANEYRAEHYNDGLAAEKFASEPVRPIPDAPELNTAKFMLGHMMYNDVRLSIDNTVSCATCHDFDKGGTDNLPFSEGVFAQFGGVNAPTVFNAVFNFVQFWDGRAADLAAQAAGPPVNPIEMGFTSWREIEVKLQADAQLVAAFTEIYPDGVTEANITDAIAEYEKSLVTPNSPFDLYLKGDETAINDMEKAGYELFKSNNCATCHAGINMGGLSYDYIGLKEDYFAARGTELTEEDYGRGKQEEDTYYDHRFKTPGLRNIALTAPYFHDATQKTLSEAVTAMMRYQIGENLSDEETEQMVSFLETLTGEIPAK